MTPVESALTHAAKCAVAADQAVSAPEITIVIDTREQRPWTFNGRVMQELAKHGSAAFVRVATVRGTLDTGDYALLGREELARYERKSLVDFVACCGRERARFWKELERLARFPHRAVLVEASITAIEEWAYRSQISPVSILASANAIETDFGIPVVWAANPYTAEWMCAWRLRRVLHRANKAAAAATEGAS